MSYNKFKEHSNMWLSILLVLLVAYSILGWSLYFLQSSFVYKPTKNLLYNPGDLNLTYEKVVLKTEDGLKEGLHELDDLRKIATEKLYATDPRELRLACEVDNMLVCQEMHARAALLRTETRGPHNRLDYPYMDNDLWIKEIRIKKADGEMKLYTRPLRRGYVKIPKGRIPIKGM